MPSGYLNESNNRIPACRTPYGTLDLPPEDRKRSGDVRERLATTVIDDFRRNAAWWIECHFRKAGVGIPALSVCQTLRELHDFTMKNDWTR